MPESDAAMSETAADSAPKSEHLVFEGEEGALALDVRLEDETLWMTQAQMARVFSVTTNTVSEHLSRIIGSGELEREAVVRRYRILRQEGARRVEREILHYNLDAVIALGYRVSSSRGTRFRRWATTVLRERLKQDVERRARAAESAALVDLRNALAEQKRAQDQAERVNRRRLGELQTALSLAKTALEAHDMVSEEAAAVLSVIDRYARSFTLLLQYDEDRLPEAPDAPSDAMVELQIDEARAVIQALKAKLAERGEDTALLGQERGEGLEGILGAIEQTFGGMPLYPNVEVRAANLLYFIIKDHPFSDGNKRIGSFLFLHYLDKNGRLFRDDGRPMVEDNALVAIALLIAESDPNQRELVIRLVLGLLNEPRRAA